MSGIGASTGARAAELRWLDPIVRWLRWAAIAVGSLLAVLDVDGTDPVPLGIAAALLVGLATLVTVTRDHPSMDAGALVLVESLVALTAIVVTGSFQSPFGLYAMIPALLATVVFGRAGLALLPLLAGLLLVSEVIRGWHVEVATVTALLVPAGLAATVGLVGRGMVVQAQMQHSQTLGRIQQLSHVNALLSSLHDLVRSTPAPLTVEDVMRVARAELDDLFEADAIMLLLADPGGRWYRPVSVDGAAMGSEVAYADLPAELLEGGPSSRPIQIPRLGEDTGLTPGARSGAYLWLWSRGQPAGLLALEHHEPRELSRTHIDMLDRVSAPLGLAIDNAIWFQRLRTLGAEDERQRIGAQLHDQFAQSLAYVKMELDRISSRYEDESLDRLRTDVQRTLSDLRETLRELRLRCTDDVSLVRALSEHAERFGERFGVMINVDVPEGFVRPPLTIENQLLRIAQDLLVLAQREAAATSIHVGFAADSGRLRMVVRDDGRGVPEDRLSHEAARMVALARHRADAIGALVDVFTREGEGTEVAITVRGLL